MEVYAIYIYIYIINCGTILTLTLPSKIYSQSVLLPLCLMNGDMNDINDAKSINCVKEHVFLTDDNEKFRFNLIINFFGDIFI